MMQASYARAAAALAAAASCALLLGCQANGAGVTPALPTTTAQNSQLRPSAALGVGVVIPMYVDPGPIWDQVIAQKRAHPKVPVLLIADITNTGVGDYKYGNYSTYIAKERAAGVKVIGYVATGYGKYSQPSVETQMNRWYAWYRVDGIFLDEANPADGSFFRAVTAYAHEHSLPFVMANPGEDAPANLGPDVINFYESPGYPTLAYLSSPSHVTAGSKRWSYMAGDVSFNPSFIAKSAKYVSYVYALDVPEPECYCRLPTYFPQLMTLLSHLDGG